MTPAAAHVFSSVFNVVVATRFLALGSEMMLCLVSSFVIGCALSGLTARRHHSNTGSVRPTRFNSKYSECGETLNVLPTGRSSGHDGRCLPYSFCHSFP